MMAMVLQNKLIGIPYGARNDRESRLSCHDEAVVSDPRWDSCWPAHRATSLSTTHPVPRAQPQQAPSRRSPLPPAWPLLALGIVEGQADPIGQRPVGSPSRDLPARAL